MKFNTLHQEMESKLLNTYDIKEKSKQLRETRRQVKEVKVYKFVYLVVSFYKNNLWNISMSLRNVITDHSRYIGTIVSAK